MVFGETPPYLSEKTKCTGLYASCKVYCTNQKKIIGMAHWQSEISAWYRKFYNLWLATGKAEIYQ